MNALTFRLHLLEPVLVSRTEAGEENSAVGLSFIPGGALRGAFVSLYLGEYPTADLAVDQRARRLFFDHAVCFLNAYPCVGSHRLLPRPMSWLVEKDERESDYAGIWDFAIDGDHALPKPKPPLEDFCRIMPASEEIDTVEEEPFRKEQEKSPPVVLYSPARHLNVHIALNDANYRSEQNKVYRYDALAEGEVLEGVVIAEDIADLELLRGLLVRDEFRIGRARTAGYGRVQITDFRIEHEWHEYALADDPKDGRVVVTLLSDAILRGKDGQVNGDLDAALATALHRPDLRAIGVFRRLGLAGGFNRKWSLPVVQSWALKAGSVYVYDSSDVDPAALWALTDRGIGERRAEGFGRFAVNWHTSPKLERTEVEKPRLPRIVLSQGSKALARQMAQRRLRLLLDRMLAEAVNKTALSLFQPQNAQLSRVRNAAQASIVEGSLEPVTKLLANLKSTHEQFLKARVGTARMLDWLRERTEKQDLETELLGSNPLPGVAGENGQLIADIRVEYTARLIDGVMKKAIRQNQQPDWRTRKAV